MASSGTIQPFVCDRGASLVDVVVVDEDVISIRIGHGRFVGDSNRVEDDTIMFLCRRRGDDDDDSYCGRCCGVGGMTKAFVQRTVVVLHRNDINDLVDDSSVISC